MIQFWLEGQPVSGLKTFEIYTCDMPCVNEMQMNDQYKTIRIGLSPCPNDTFIFHALLHGLAGMAPGVRFEAHMADVETLNSLALGGELEITKISLGVMPHIGDRYALLSSGAALGWGCGPLVVAARALEQEEIREGSIAIPGKMTTANLLLALTGQFRGPRREMIFSDVIPSVAEGKTELGVIIHEGRFTYRDAGLVKIMDLGQWWERAYGLPLPLGAIAVRRDVPHDLAHAVQDGIRASLAHARANPGAALEFARRNAQELKDEVIRAHIDTFVTDYSLSLGDTGKKAIAALMDAAGEKSVAKPYFLDD